MTTLDNPVSVQARLPLEVPTDSVPVRAKKMHVKKSTFLGGVDKPFHGWFRLTPSFGPELVQHTLAKMETGEHDVVLDPFSGAGTTLIEARLQGLRAVGFELNPLLHFVCRVSTNWGLDVQALRADLRTIKTQTQQAQRQAIGKRPDQLGLDVPPIHNIDRWWRPDVQIDLLLVRDSIEHLENPANRDFFLLALAGVLVPDLTNVTLGRLQLHFIDRTNDTIDVLGSFVRYAERMIADVERHGATRDYPRADVFHVDSTSLPNLEMPPASRVVTSPPYPNRYSYVWNTRPHLYLLRLMNTGKEAADLDKKAIGGTWGTATSMLAKGELRAESDEVASTVGPIVSEIRQKDNLMANYVMKYFNMLARQVREQERYLAPQARLAYVVGCSRVSGVYVETDVLLGRILEGMGYRLDEVERFRKRHSDKDLHESTVFARRA